MGGYEVHSFGSSEQKNHPTVGRVPNGAVVEREAPIGFGEGGKELDVVLFQPDFTTAERVAESLRHTAGVNAIAEHAGKVKVTFDQPPGDMVRMISMIENVMVTPDQAASVVVNERTGTVVSGGDVRLASRDGVAGRSEHGGPDRLSGVAAGGRLCRSVAQHRHRGRPAVRHRVKDPEARMVNSRRRHRRGSDRLHFVPFTSRRGM